MELFELIETLSTNYSHLLDYDETDQSIYLDNEKNIESIDIINPTILSLDDETFDFDKYLGFKEEIEKNGIEAIAWYKPYHLLNNENWGIYIREKSLLFVLSYFKQKNPKQPTFYLLNESFKLIVKHELFHFFTENATTFFELIPSINKQLYIPLLRNKNKPAIISNNNHSMYKHFIKKINQKLSTLNVCEIEESLANLNALSARYRFLNTPDIKSFMDLQPKGYSDYGLFQKKSNYGKRFLLYNILDSQPNDIIGEYVYYNYSSSQTSLVPIYLIRDEETSHGAGVIQLSFNTHNTTLTMHIGDHPPAHIHVRIPSNSKEEIKLKYPSLEPMKGFRNLSNSEMKNVNKVIASPKFKKSIKKYPWIN